jgi:hypothetical protein
MEGLGWSGHTAFDLALDAITHSDEQPSGRRTWLLEGDFVMRVSAIGFNQYVRRPPVLSNLPRLAVNERGGISFNKSGYQL